MEFECKLTKTEASEAVRLNRTKVSRLWWLLRYLRLIMVFGVLVVVTIANLRSRTPNWPAVVGLAFAAAFLAIAAVWSWSYRDKRRAQRMNAAGERMTLDANGISTVDAAGAKTFTPWAQFRDWREGKHVFTAGNGKKFCTIPKRAMSEAQVAEVRGILQTQIRTQ